MTEHPPTHGTSTEQLRQANEQRAAEDFEQGPIAHDQGTIPLIEGVRTHDADDVLSTKIPAHKKGKGAPRSAVEALGTEVYRHDVLSLQGLDNRHQSWKVRSTAEELFAEAVGAEQSLFSTGGSTTSVHAAMHGVVGPGDELVLTRNAHISVITGLILTGAVPVWLDPSYDDELQIAHGATAEAMAGALEQHPDARAAMVVAPTYYGVSADISGLVQVCHRHGIPLITDAAWGLTYSFSEALPTSAISDGSDITIGSVHKTMGGLAQTSVISVQGDLIDSSRLLLALRMFESTSTSSILLTSIDAARHDMVHRGEELIRTSLRLAERLREELDEIDGIGLITEERLLRDASACAVNPQHVSFDVTGLGLTGYEAGDWLRDETKIDAELSDHRRVMFMVSIGDDDESITRLADGVDRLADAHRDRSGSRVVPQMPRTSQLRGEHVMTPRDAFFAPATSVGLSSSVGRTSAEFITAYPPGIPLLVPGERVTPEIVEYLDAGAAAGIKVEGAVDSTLREIRVVA